MKNNLFFIVVSLWKKSCCILLFFSNIFFIFKDQWFFKSNPFFSLQKHRETLCLCNFSLLPLQTKNIWESFLQNIFFLFFQMFLAFFHRKVKSRKARDKNTLSFKKTKKVFFFWSNFLPNCTFQLRRGGLKFFNLAFEDDNKRRWCPDMSRHVQTAGYFIFLHLSRLIIEMYARLWQNFESSLSSLLSIGFIYTCPGWPGFWLFSFPSLTFEKEAGENLFFWTHEWDRIERKIQSFEKQNLIKFAFHFFNKLKLFKKSCSNTKTRSLSNQEHIFSIQKKIYHLKKKWKFTQDNIL